MTNMNNTINLRNSTTQIPAYDLTENTHTGQIFMRNADTGEFKGSFGGGYGCDRKATWREVVAYCVENQLTLVAGERAGLELRGMDLTGVLFEQE